MKHYSLSSLSFPHWFVVWQGLRTITRYWTARLHCQYNLVQNFNIMPRNYLMWFTSSWQLIIWVFVNSNWISICLKQRVMWRDEKCSCLNSLAGSLLIALGCMVHTGYSEWKYETIFQAWPNACWWHYETREVQSWLAILFIIYQILQPPVLPYQQNTFTPFS